MRRRLRSLNLLILFILPIAIPAAASVPISGQIVDGTTGKPLAGMSIALYPTRGGPLEAVRGEKRPPRTVGMERLVIDPGEERAKPDEDEPPLDTSNTLVNGTFVLRAPTSGQFEVRVGHPYTNWDDWSPDPSTPNRVVTATGKGATLGRWLVNERPSVDIAVRGPDGKPFNGKVDCWVWSLGKWPDSSISHQQHLTAARGIVSVAGPGEKALQAGVSLIEFRSAASGVAEVVINAWTGKVRTVRLQPGGTILGQAFDQSGKPMAGADVRGDRVAAAGAAWVPVGIATTADPDGRFALRSLPPGDYVVDAGLPGGKWDGTWLAHVSAGRDSVVKLTAGVHDDVSPEHFNSDYWVPWMTIADRVGRKPAGEVVIPVYVDGSVSRRPDPGVYVGLIADDQWETLADTARTGPDGQAVLRAPGPGSYKVQFLDECPWDREADTRIGITIKGRESPAPVDMHAIPHAHFRPIDALGRPVRFMEGDSIHAWMPVRILEGDSIQAGIWTVQRDGRGSEWRASAWYASDGSITVSFGDSAVDPAQIRTALVEVRVPGYGIGSARIDGWNSQVHDIVISPGIDQSAIVLDADGKPVVSTELTWRRLPGAGPGNVDGGDSVTTGVDGSIRLPHMFPGTVALDHSWWDEEMHPKVFRHTTWLLRPGADHSGQAVSPCDKAFPWLWATVYQDGALPGSEVVRKVSPDALAEWLTVPGRTVDGRGSGVGGALVFLRPAKTQEVPYPTPVDDVVAARDGTFTLCAPGVGYYEIQVEASHFRIACVPITLTVAAKAPVEVHLKRLPVARLKLLGPDGKPLPAGTPVAVIRPQNGGNRSPGADPAPIAPDGFFNIEADGPWDSQRVAGGIVEDRLVTRPGVPDPPVSLDAVLSVEGVGMARLSLDEWPANPLVVHLRPAHDLTGIMVDSYGRPRSGIGFSLAEVAPSGRPQDGQDQIDANSGPDGRFEFDALPGFGYRISVFGESWDPSWGATLSMPKTDLVLTPFTLPGTKWQAPLGNSYQTAGALPPDAPGLQPPTAPTPGCLVSGLVLSSGSHQPIQGALALLYGASRDVALGMAFSDAEGAFRLKAPTAGPYRIGIAWRGYLERVVNVDIRSGQVLAGDITISEDPLLRFRLLGPDGKTLRGGAARVEVLVSSDAGQESAAASAFVTSDGGLIVQPPVQVPLESIIGLEIWVRADTIGWAHLHLDHWPQSKLSVRLSKGCSVDGRVVGSDGAPVANVTVSVKEGFETVGPEGSDNSGFATFDPISVNTDTGPDGAFHVVGLMPGGCYASVSVRSGESSTDGAVPYPGPVRIVTQGTARSDSEDHAP